ncbi:MAG: NADH-quinone oxidoreductase subunit A [Mucilaginibacter polytrichastri]|nr:NADH-quinone oxidoreductase subunit A [Mucilaginibacter polytrichastri]
MQHKGQLSEFGMVFVFIITGAVLVSFILLLSRLLSPRNPTPVKNSSYECGVPTSGNSWVQFNSRFYVIALIFLLFEVELAFIFPVAGVFADPGLINVDKRWGWITLGELFLFITILFFGLIYVWNRGDLDWIKPVKRKLSTGVPIRSSLYDRINAEVYVVKPFSPGKIADEEKSPAKTAPSAPRKPMFKPAFKKPDEPGKTTE